MATIHSVLEGNIQFTKHKINGGVETHKDIINGDVRGEAMRSVPDYTGSYEITPNGTTQVLIVSNKRMTEDLVINPIPSNYGLISWDGSGILIS